MNTTRDTNRYSAEKKSALCIVLSMFYFLMLAYPLGVSVEGYVWQRVLIAIVIFFAISIPAWIINLKREFYDTPQSVGTVDEMLENELDVLSPENMIKAHKIGELARMQKWLSLEDIAQILFCMGGECGSKFGQIAIKRNYLTPEQVDTLLAMQQAAGK